MLKSYTIEEDFVLFTKDSLKIITEKTGFTYQGFAGNQDQNGSK